MLIRLALSLAILLALTLPTLADTTLVDEDFESYNNNTELLAAWPSQSGGDNGLELVDVNTVDGGADGADFLEIQRTNPAGIADWQASYGPATQKYPGIDGQAAQFCGSIVPGVCDPTGAGTVNLWNGNPLIDVYPTDTQNVELSFDLGDDALSANKRLTIGMRSLAPVENIIEMGLYNDPSGFAYRAQLFFTGGESNPDWVEFGDATKVDNPLDPALDSQEEVGAGFHTYKAVIGIDQIVFSLDLYADGVKNDPANPVPGVGTPGVDASDTVLIETTFIGFEDLRIGIPSSLPSSGTSSQPGAAFAAFDNISLKLVDIPQITTVPEPTTALLVLLATAGLLVSRQR